MKYPRIGTDRSATDRMQATARRVARSPEDRGKTPCPGPSPRTSGVRRGRNGAFGSTRGARSGAVRSRPDGAQPVSQSSPSTPVAPTSSRV